MVEKYFSTSPLFCNFYNAVSTTKVHSSYKIPFGFVTTESSAEMRSRAAQTGAKFLITKPFTAEIFAKVLDAFLKK